MSELEAVLAEHLWRHTATTHCACGFRTPFAQRAVDGYLAHVAAAVREWAEGRAGVVAEALRDTGLEGVWPEDARAAITALFGEDS